VKVDHLSHLLIECLHGEDRTETGLRGIMNLVENGLMLRPREMHVDPLQRWIEIDGHRFSCTDEDAARFGQLLNAEFAPKLRPVGEGTIEIKDNPASATGFDIHFVSFHGGMRTEVKGHLTQERLNQLQDDQHCGLMQHGILFRLSPPNLLIRRRRQDGGEERIPEIPDVQYRRIKAADLQRLFNNPRLRRSGGTGVEPEEPPAPPAAASGPEPPPTPPPPNPPPCRSQPQQRHRLPCLPCRSQPQPGQFAWCRRGHRIPRSHHGSRRPQSLQPRLLRHQRVMWRAPKTSGPDRSASRIPHTSSAQSFPSWLATWRYRFKRFI
jgi:hypothetical protein